MSLEKALLTALRDKLASDKLVLPTLPEVALRVADSVEDPDSSLKDIATIIANDPALTARMIRVANSAFYARQSRVSNLQDAVNRVGLRSIKNIATAMAMEQVYMAQTDAIFDLMDECWRSSTSVSAAAMALYAIYRKEKGGNPLEADMLSLMGVVHNIGALPILLEVERLPKIVEQPHLVKRVVNVLSGEVGESIMRTWNFGDDFVDVVGKLKTASYQPDSPHYIDFIRMAAIYSGEFGDDPLLQESLLQPYVDKGLISGMALFVEEEFIELYKQNNASFI